MKTLAEAVKAANKGPASVDNHLMIVAADGDYLARIDASEGRKWRASAALLVHGFNQLQGSEKALRLALEVIRDCQMPKTYHRTKAEVLADIEGQIEKLNQVKEIGDGRYAGFSTIDNMVKKCVEHAKEHYGSNLPEFNNSILPTLIENSLSANWVGDDGDSEVEPPQGVIDDALQLGRSLWERERK